MIVGSFCQLLENNKFWCSDKALKNKGGTCLLWTHWALFVSNTTSCELYFVWERKDRVTNLELPPKAECPLSPQGPKIHTNRAVCLFGNGVCGCLYWRFPYYPSVTWDSLLKVLWVFPSPAQFGQHLKRGPKSESHPRRKCVIRRVAVLCLLYDHMSVQSGLYVLECLFVCKCSCCCLVMGICCVVTQWRVADVWPRLIALEHHRDLSCDNKTCISFCLSFVFLFCYEHLGCFSLISINF